MRWKAPSDARLRSRFDTLARLVAIVGSRSNSVFSEAFEEIAEELRPSLAMAFSTRGDTLTLLAEHRLGGVVPMPWRRFKAGDALALPLHGALRTRRPTHLPLNTPEGAAAFAAWGPLLARGADVAFVVPAVNRADVLALALFFFPERSLDEGITQFLQTVSALLGLALALQAERELDATRSAELAETTRLATLGTLSATVAHELRGPAGALALLVPELQLAIGSADADAIEPLLNDMRTCVERIGGLCGQLGNLNYHDEAPESFDLRGVAAEVVALARVHAQGAGVVMIEELSPVAVVGRRDQIGQVILNLALNAIDACREMTGGGVKHVVVKTDLDDGRAVIEVADSGPGLSKEAAERIFQPFFTTKPRGKGTGLGLSVSRDIVSSHRGHIVVGSSRWGGALFRVELPVHDPETTSRRLAPQGTSPRPGPVSTPDLPSARAPFAAPESPAARSPHGSAPDATPPPAGQGSASEPLRAARPRLGSAPELPPVRPRLGSAPELGPVRPRLGSAPELPPPSLPRGPAPEPPPSLPRGPAPEPPPSLPRGPAPETPPSPSRFGPAPEASLPPSGRLSREGPPNPSRPPFAPPRASAAVPPPPPPRPRLGSMPEGPPSARPRAAIAPPDAAPQAALRVLVVDDDKLLLSTMKRVMRGFDVTTASTIDEARRALEAGGAFDLVVTDVNMPGGSGLDLHRRLALERPALAHKLIFLSGGALTTADAEYLRSSGCVCLPKPVALDTLLDAVRSVARAGKPPTEVSLTLRPPPGRR